MKQGPRTVAMGDCFTEVIRMLYKIGQDDHHENLTCNRTRPIGVLVLLIGTTNIMVESSLPDV